MLVQEDSSQILPKLEKIVIKLVSSFPPTRFRIFVQTFYPVQEFSMKNDTLKNSTSTVIASCACGATPDPVSGNN